MGSDGGARPLNLPFMQVFEERNWSLDFFRHACLIFIGMPELTSFGWFFFDRLERSGTHELRSKRTAVRNQKTDVKISWDSLLHREVPLENQHTKKDVMLNSFQHLITMKTNIQPPYSCSPTVPPLQGSGSPLSLLFLL